MAVHFTKYTPQRARRFLDALRRPAPVGIACEAAGICRKTAYNWRDDKPEFKDAWEEALERGTEALEEESFRRAFDGSDQQLTLQLKARRPDVYRDRATTDLNVAGGVTVRIEGDDAAL